MNTSVSEVTLNFNPKDVTLIHSKLSKFKTKREGIEEPMIHLVATQKEDIMKELFISKALFLLKKSPKGLGRTLVLGLKFCIQPPHPNTTYEI